MPIKKKSRQNPPFLPVILAAVIDASPDEVAALLAIQFVEWWAVEWKDPSKASGMDILLAVLRDPNRWGPGQASWRPQEPSGKRPAWVVNQITERSLRRGLASLRRRGWIKRTKAFGGPAEYELAVPEITFQQAWARVRGRLPEKTLQNLRRRRGPDPNQLGLFNPANMAGLGKTQSGHSGPSIRPLWPDTSYRQKESIDEYSKRESGESAPAEKLDFGAALSIWRQERPDLEPDGRDARELKELFKVRRPTAEEWKAAVCRYRDGPVTPYAKGQNRPLWILAQDYNRYSGSRTPDGHCRHERTEVRRNDQGTPIRHCTEPGCGHCWVDKRIEAREATERAQAYNAQVSNENEMRRKVRQQAEDLAKKKRFS